MNSFKSITLILTLAISGICIFSSCEKDESSKPLTIGGQTDLAKNQVGSTFTGITYIGNDGPNIDADMEVVKFENDIITLKVSIPVIPAILGKVNPLGTFILGDDFMRNPQKYLDGNGNLSTEINVFNSSEGVAIISPSGKQQVIMKYDAKVNESWSFKNEDTERKYNLKTTYRSTEDDYDYVFFKIKVVKIEMTSEDPEIDKIVIIGNHKFGLVGIQTMFKDGTVFNTVMI
ncbi:MAG: hypothetical protein GX128_05915 [Bacteroidales bacterium]|jgi:hypothetical protein|nr:hypothetical protein [Bacteroidales bacterium]